MTELALFNRRDLHDHDLPPKWDGHPVEWHGWKSPIPMFICGNGRKRQDCCEGCGSQRPASTNHGIIRHHKSGRVLDSLFAFRCPDCYFDTVIEGCGRNAKFWTLDETDYSDKGSIA